MGLCGTIGRADPPLAGHVRRDALALVESAICVVRRRRSLKAIETYEQVKYVVPSLVSVVNDACLTTPVQIPCAVCGTSSGYNRLIAHSHSPRCLGFIRYTLTPFIHFRSRTRILSSGECIDNIPGCCSLAPQFFSTQHISCTYYTNTASSCVV